MITLFENFNDSKSIKTSELWVSFNRGDTDIYEVYLNKEGAEKAANDINSKVYDYEKKSHSDMSDEEFSKYIKQRGSHHQAITLEDAL
jgi:hypothetical protein